MENLSNIMLFLENLNTFSGLWWDTFHAQPMLGKKALTEKDILDLLTQMTRSTKMPINNFRNFVRCVHAVCHQHDIDPLQEFLANLPPWDQQSRIDTFFPAYAGSPDTPFTRWVGRNFWCQLTNRILHPGSQGRSVVILHGKENTGKSALCRAIGSPWSGTLERGFDSKEAKMLLHGVLVMELPELGSFSRTEEIQIKSFISEVVDSYIPKYSNDRVVIPRRTVFIGTTNEDESMPGQTGNTRFNPIETTTIRYEECARDRDQLLAEAQEYLRQQCAWWEEPPALGGSEERHARRKINIYEGSLKEWLATDMAGESLILWQQVARHFLGIETRERWKDFTMQKQIREAFIGLGYRYVQQRTPEGATTHIRGWRKSA